MTRCGRAASAPGVGQVLGRGAGGGVAGAAGASSGAHLVEEAGDDRLEALHDHRVGPLLAAARHDGRRSRPRQGKQRRVRVRRLRHARCGGARAGGRPEPGGAGGGDAEARQTAHKTSRRASPSGSIAFAPHGPRPTHGARGAARRARHGHTTRLDGSAEHTVREARRRQAGTTPPAGARRSVADIARAASTPGRCPGCRPADSCCADADAFRKRAGVAKF